MAEGMEIATGGLETEGEGFGAVSVITSTVRASRRGSG